MYSPSELISSGPDCKSCMQKQHPPAFSLILLAVIFSTLTLSCSSAGSGTEAQTTGQPLRSGAFQLRVMEESLLAGGEFSLAQETDGSDIQLKLEAYNVHDLKALYVELTYDPALYTPAGSPAEVLLSQTGSVLQLTASKLPGSLYHGQVLTNWPQRAGFSGCGTVVSFRFQQASQSETAWTSRSMAAAPSSDKASQYLSYSVLDGKLSWYYANPGDYDQNGLVGISDLTPLGVHFGKAGPFADSSALSVVDGDGNGLISISDITPIGTNFGNHVDSYAVYGSSSETDYPAANTADNGPGTRRLGTVPLSGNNWDATKRRSYEFMMDSPIVAGRYWVRPASAGNVGTASRLTSPYQPGWHLTDVFSYGSNIQAGAEADLAIVNGRPAILIFHSDGVNPNTKVSYRTAADELGEQWNVPVPLDNLGLNVGWTDLAQVNGKPAFCWYDDGTGRVYYKGAIDSEGMQWNNQVLVFDGYTFMALLTEHAGKPVAGYRSGGQLLLSLALDAEGGTWLPGVEQYGPIGQWQQETAIISLPGGMGTATEDLNSGALQFVYAQVSGTSISPQAPVTVFPGGVGYNLSLAIDMADGLPFVVTRRSPSNKLYFSYSEDSTGGSWTTPDITGLAGTASHFNAAGAYGVPWVVYYDDTTGFLGSGHASAPQSTSWTNEANILEIPPAGSNAIYGIRMARAGIHPAVSFNHTAANSIIYAVFY